MLGWGQGEAAAGLEVAVPVGAQPEHGAAVHDGLVELVGGAADVLHDPGASGRVEGRPGGADQIGMVVVLDALAVGVVLAGRGGVDEVETGAERADEGYGLGLVEAERVAGLGVLVDAGHREPGPVVAHAGSALAAERVQ
ncbi:hypothetical protein GCM10020254_57460 [Streptomyces goshikiensis]